MSQENWTSSGTGSTSYDRARILQIAEDKINQDYPNRFVLGLATQNVLAAGTVLYPRQPIDEETGTSPEGDEKR